MNSSSIKGIPKKKIIWRGSISCPIIATFYLIFLTSSYTAAGPEANWPHYTAVEFYCQLNFDPWNIPVTAATSCHITKFKLDFTANNNCGGIAIKGVN